MTDQIRGREIARCENDSVLFVVLIERCKTFLFVLY